METEIPTQGHTKGSFWIDSDGKYQEDIFNKEIAISLLGCGRNIGISIMVTQKEKNTYLV